MTERRLPWGYVLVSLLLAAGGCAAAWAATDGYTRPDWFSGACQVVDFPAGMPGLEGLSLALLLAAFLPVAVGLLAGLRRGLRTRAGLLAVTVLICLGAGVYGGTVYSSTIVDIDYMNQQMTHGTDACSGL